MAKLLKVLQVKSLSWFFFLIMAGLCFWFKMRLKLLRYESLESGERPESWESPEFNESLESNEARRNNDILAITENLGQVKSLIFLLFVLIAPWFRNIDKKDMQIDRPFLSFSLSNLTKDTGPGTGNGGGGKKNCPDSLCCRPGPSLVITVEQDTGAKVIRVRDTVFLQPFKIGGGLPYPFKHDPFLDTINDNILKSQGSIDALAQRTIGSAADRRSYSRR